TSTYYGLRINECKINAPTLNLYLDNNELIDIGNSVFDNLSVLKTLRCVLFYGLRGPRDRACTNQSAWIRCSIYPVCLSSETFRGNQTGLFIRAHAAVTNCKNRLTGGSNERRGDDVLDILIARRNGHFLRFKVTFVLLENSNLELSILYLELPFWKMGGPRMNPAICPYILMLFTWLGAISSCARLSGVAGITTKDISKAPYFVISFHRGGILDGIKTGSYGWACIVIHILERLLIEVFLHCTFFRILKNNKLGDVRASWLKDKKNLKILDVGDNNIREIEPGAFRDLENLVQLDISNNQLQSIPENLFQHLVSLRSVKVDHFTLCCYAKQSNPSVTCISKVDNGFSSCDELLKNTVLKYSIWILGIMAFAGNLIVIIWRSIAKDANRINSFLLTNLAVADFLMGVYMLIIAYKDTLWDGVYFKHDVAWRASDLCIFAGVISTVSSEVSVLTLTVITLDRLICIVFVFRFQRWTMKKVSAIMCVVWILGFGISLAPLFYDDYFHDYENNVHFFGRSAVCLPLQLSSDRPSGWQYSVFVFLVLNAVSFLFILLAYVVMYHTIVKSARAVRSTRMNQDSTLAKRMMFIILTDFACWFPVIIISILALTGNLYDPTKQVYAWIAVFVLPINSSINPLLYTFSTPYVRGKIPTARQVLSRMRKRNRDEATHTQFSSIGSHDDNLNAIASPMKIPQSLRKQEKINEGYTTDANVAECSFAESATTAMEYRIRLVENVVMLNDGNVTMKSYAVVKVGGEETPCLVNVYNGENEGSWRDTENILSWLSLDGGHENILPFLWSAKGDKVLVEKQDSSNTMLELKANDCLICYELPSKQTLDGFLKMNNHEITEEIVYYILNDLIEAIDYLSSKQIAHHAILPENIILVESSQLALEGIVLGGLHAAKLLTSSPEEKESNNGLSEENLEELEVNVISFGNVIKILLDVCPTLEKFSDLHDLMVSCLSHDSKPTTSYLVKQLVLMDKNYRPSDTIL
ncbi:G- coupled receptor GRL101-like, partial [Paramuricea clavata]